MSKLKKIAPCTYLLEKEGGMRVPGLIIASEELLSEMEIEQPLNQVRNVAHLQGIVGYSIAMPDIHWGYGFPIGGVAAMDVESGVISPGGVGYDINCGVRLALAPIEFQSLDARAQRGLLQEIYNLVPSGVGHGRKGTALSEQDYRALLEQGAAWAVSSGYGFARDLDHIESRGRIEGANIDSVSEVAKARGKSQLGSIGSGNHFVEVGEVQQIFSEEIASLWGLKLGQIYILIHSGSRGFGHQVCQDTLDEFASLGFTKNLPDTQLACAPIKSPPGQRYFSGMAAAANFAFNNRQEILHYVRKAFQKVLSVDPEKIELLYDVCHNIAKFETHSFEGKEKRLCVHRKGATRAFGPGAAELPSIFQKSGQPVFLPGDMGRASYIMAGLGNPLTWCSASHGAGRAKSRVKSFKDWKKRDPIGHMKEQGIQVMAASFSTVAEEMPDAYKNVDLVAEATHEAGLARRIARLKPRLVVKG